MSRTFYEFFAGGGMARLGLGEAWTCAFANDFDAAKASAYRANFPDAGTHLVEGDVWALTAADLPGQVDLAWASSPCQDFSLAGGRAGLAGGRSSAFYGFWKLMEALGAEGRAPRTLVIENVTGLLTSNAGADFAALCAALASQGYCYGALEIDAAPFLPQSRPRVFVIAARGRPAGLTGPSPFRTPAILKAFEGLPAHLKPGWMNWAGEAPARRNMSLSDLLEPDGEARWNTPEETDRLLSLMSPAHLARIEALKSSGQRAVGALFRRTRRVDGERRQRAEVRFDGLAGCLRTPRGGSSRQTLVLVDGGEVRSRLISPREAARLMGMPDSYRLPRSVTAALHVTGDGVAVPAVRWLAGQILEPLLTVLDASLQNS